MSNEVWNTLDRKKLQLATGGAVLASLAVGFVSGTWVTGASAPVALTEARAGVAAALQPAPASPLGGAFAAERAAPGCGHDHGHTHPRAEPGSLAGLDQEVASEGAAPAPPDFGAVLAAVRAAGEMPDDYEAQEAARLAADDLELRLLADPNAVRAALAAFRGLRDREGLELLAALLGRVRDPEVEDAALAIAGGDPDPLRREVAFDILDAFNTPRARTLALETLARESHVDLRRAALRAIAEPQGASLEDARPVAAAMAGILASDPDAEARRRAAMLLGRWASDEAAFQPVVEALRNDPDPNVRAGAAFAFEVSRHSSPRLAQILIDVVGDGGEDPLVRDNAWHALGNLGPLGPEEHAAYRAYGDERDARGEVVELDPADPGFGH